MNFLITAMGRSGTSFLSRLMNRSPTWNVAHEPVGRRDSLEKFNHRLRDHYGEVNSFTRFFFHAVKVSKKGVLIRDPMLIARSAYNRPVRFGPDLKYDYSTDRINTALKILDEGVKRGATIIECKNLSNIDYCQWVVNHFGIDDLIVLPRMMNPVNVTRDPKPLPPDLKKAAYEKFGWFLDKYRSVL